MQANCSTLSCAPTVQTALPTKAYSHYSCASVNTASGFPRFAGLNSLAAQLQALRPAVLQFCLRYLHNENDAQEACQDTMLNAVKALDSFQYRASLKTWVLKIAYHACASYYRNNKLEGTLFVEFDEAMFESQDALIEEDNPDLVKIVATLSELQQQILRYRFVEDLSLNEISAVIGVKLSCIKMNYYRALDKIQKTYMCE